MALWANEHLGAMLSASQLGVTLASLGLGWVGEPYLAHRLSPGARAFRRDGPGHGPPPWRSPIAFTVITFVHITFGELGPKAVAIQPRPRKTALWLSAPAGGSSITASILHLGC